MKKLFDSGELGRAESKNPAQLPCRSYFDRFFSPTRTRETTSAFVNNCVLAKSPWRSRIFWAKPQIASNVYQPRRTIRVASDILKMNLTLRYFLSLTLKLASERWKSSCRESEYNFWPWRLSHGDQSFPQHFHNCNGQGCTVITLLDDSNLNAFQIFWPRLNIVRLADVP